MVKPYCSNYSNFLRVSIFFLFYGEPIIVFKITGKAVREVHLLLKVFFSSNGKHFKALCISKTMEY